MDRDELQDRIRARRSGADPYRRGGPADDVPGYERYEPEPEDDRARPSRAADQRHRDYFDERPAAAPVPDRTEPEWPEARRDLTRETDDHWAAPVAAGTSAAAAGAAAAGEPADEPTYVDNFDDAAYGDETYYEYDQYPDEERRSGGGALAIVGFLALGVLALLGGAALAGVFGEDENGVAQPTPTPTVTSSPIATESPTLTPSPDATAAETPDATASPDEEEPVVFPDGFTAEAEPCLPGSAGNNGCDSNGARNSGTVQIWVGFRNGTASDVIGSELIGPEGNTISTGSIDLARINCGNSCNGYTYFNYANLEPGTYEVEITRNGQLADTITFEVE